MKNFDLIAIGVGMAGNVAARKCATAGWQVAVIDELPYGGTCALRGCDPKKMLRRGAEIIDAAQLMKGKGVDPGGLAINWPELMAHKRSFTEEMPDKIESGLDGAGVETLHGRARFLNENTIELADGTRLQGEKFLIASGARPRDLDFPGAEHVIDSTAFLELDTLPKRVAFLGGGFVSMEFAHIVARAGTSATVIDRGARPLKNFDPDLVEMLVKRSAMAGIDIRTGTDVTGVRKTASGFTVVAAQDGAPVEIEADLVVHGAGRVPVIGHLDLAAAGIAFEDKGVSVRAHLQSTTQPHVYAAGDAAASPGQPLTPVAVFEGKVAASNMLNGTKKEPDYRGVPSVVFTVPELARVGLLEEEAREQGLDVSVKYTDTSGWYSNLRVGETTAAAKVITDKATGKLVGAHLFGPEYGELINFFGLAMRLDLPGKALRAMVAAYPSVGSDLGSML
ncbi:dihydrolipoyl dehydrogenase family protein [Oricola cellulosilytica]|uniref:NAD(P)/FAD-dependent oxidoreductase n=1 Tax=Oricola cellulosilytica TaxID=1429082 RepID=A0A4V2MQ17_9HYPH|nr:NAD(P)/FAD-dependent oxidoreductase [Oricola cellulosilytica]TCD16222.1 NAD(P)/FAD-dependent oxidoreductase [Oricola cellulosilytica]